MYYSIFHIYLKHKTIGGMHKTYNAEEITVQTHALHGNWAHILHIEYEILVQMCWSHTPPPPQNSRAGKGTYITMQISSRLKTCVRVLCSLWESGAASTELWIANGFWGNEHNLFRALFIFIWSANNSVKLTAWPRKHSTKTRITRESCSNAYIMNTMQMCVCVRMRVLFIMWPLNC